MAESLKLHRVYIPHYKLSGQDAVLECEFELGRDRLYAVKWYKDNEEFFRYVPRFSPPIYTHPVDGANVDVSWTKFSLKTSKVVCDNKIQSYQKNMGNKLTKQLF